MSVYPTLTWWLFAPQRLWTRWVEGYAPAPGNWPTPIDTERLGMPPGVSLPRPVPDGWALDYYRRPRRLFGRTGVGAAVFRFKYRGDLDSGWRLVFAAARFLQQKEIIGAIDLVIAAPASPVFRDFSPSTWLSRKLAEIIGKPTLTDIFERIRLALPQKNVTSSRNKKANVAGIFTVPESARHALNGRRILLVDDVCDSGFTLAELREVLRSAGAGTVIPFAFAETGGSKRKL